MDAKLILDFRIQIGDTTDPKIFTDDEITVFLETAEGNTTKAKIAFADRLIADNHKLHAWTTGKKSGSPAQVVSNLISWRAELAKELEQNTFSTPETAFAGGVEQWG